MAERKLFSNAAEVCRQQGVPISKLTLQFASQNPEIPTALFSSTRAESVRRNVQWHEEPFDPTLLATVRLILAPVINKQWDYDAAVDRLKTGTRPELSPVAAANPPIECELAPPS